jgi:hypothetical protein
LYNIKNAIGKLICQFRVSDHSLGIERERYYEIPRHLILCKKCGVVDDEAHIIHKQTKRLFHDITTVIKCPLSSVPKTV